MKKKCASILAAIICFLGLGVAAKAEIRHEIVVTLPFEFVVGGKTLPAGTSRVSRLASDRFAGLILSSYENRISVFVHPVEIESAYANKPHLSFERVGEQHFLSRIQTTDDVYTKNEPRNKTFSFATLFLAKDSHEQHTEDLLE